MTEYIVQIEDSEKNMSERFVGQLRSYPELIRCKDCKYYSKEDEICIEMIGGSCNEDGYCAWAERKEE